MNSTPFFTIVIVLGMVALGLSPVAMADGFGTGANQFEIDFVTISGATNPTSGYGIVDGDYRMGTFEITNDQWTKFQAELCVPVTGDPSSAYDASPYWTGTNVPSNNVSWYEAAQFVNWLNTSTGHQAAYKFTGTQGTSDYALATWSTAEADGTNLYRHRDAFYFLPTEDEWVKAAYWNGTSLQTYATQPGETLHQGDGTTGTGWNYWDEVYATTPSGLWDVGSGSEELNGTYDMMGNVWEWMENSYYANNYGTDIGRALRGGSYFNGPDVPAQFWRGGGGPLEEVHVYGFRVASDTPVPEPATMSLLTLGGVALLRRRK